ncbi:MAG: Na+/H+ antiporter NhaC family protein [Planctomycetota bacterium]
MQVTWLSLLPALVAITVAIWSRQVLLALLLGVLSGSVVYLVQALLGGTGLVDAVVGANPIRRFFLPALGREAFAKILLIYLWALGGLLGIWNATGGARHFAATLGHRMVRGPRTALLFAWFTGVVFHQGGTISTVLAGSTVKPVTDQHRISHEELSYVVDSTASPVATVLPFNAWPGYIAGIGGVIGSVPFLADAQAVTTFFFASIRFNFYGLFAVFGTLLFALGVLPGIGRRMHAARQRARATGELDAPGAEPLLGTVAAPEPVDGYRPSLWDFFAPIGTLLLVAIVPYVLYRNGLIADGDWINEAFALAVVAAVAVALLRGMRVRAVIDGFVDGCGKMTIGALILALAVTLGTVSKELGTADYVVTLLGGSMPAWALPGALSFLCMGIAFATGSSWGTYAVVVPVALPLAWSVQPDPAYVSVCFGAILGSSVFGDQCSPVSDTTILASMFTGCDVMDHVRTQLPLAFRMGLVAVGCSTVAAVV